MGEGAEHDAGERQRGVPLADQLRERHVVQAVVLQQRHWRGNVSNNTDLTVAPAGDRMVQLEDCFDIAALPGNPLDAIRAAEAAM